MDILILMSIFRLYPGFKISFEHHIVLQKRISKNLFLFGILDFLYVRRTKNINSLEPLIMGTRTSFSFRQFIVFRLHAILSDAAGAVSQIVEKVQRTVTW